MAARVGMPLQTELRRELVDLQEPPSRRRSLEDRALAAEAEGALILPRQELQAQRECRQQAPVEMAEVEVPVVLVSLLINKAAAERRG